MIQTILSIFSFIVFIYSLLCLFYILMSWLPGIKFTKFGHFVTKICEPYMNLFSRITFLRIGNFDFSPIISLGILSILTVILAGIQQTGRIFFGGILAAILSSLWGILSSILGIFFILILIRWLVLLINKGRTSYESGWNQIDMILNKITYKIAGTFVKTSLSYQKSLLVSWISILLIWILGRFFIGYLIILCNKIPF